MEKSLSAIRRKAIFLQLDLFSECGGVHVVLFGKVRDIADGEFAARGLDDGPCARFAERAAEFDAADAFQLQRSCGGDGLFKAGDADDLSRSVWVGSMIKNANFMRKSFLRCLRCLLGIAGLP